MLMFGFAAKLYQPLVLQLHLACECVTTSAGRRMLQAVHRKLELLDVFANCCAKSASIQRSREKLQTRRCIAFMR